MKKLIEVGDPHLSAPAASIQTSSSLSDRRVISAPTTFFPCNNRRVDGSFCMRLDTATHAHLRSEASGFSNYNANEFPYTDLAIRRTFWMIGNTASFLGEDEAADSRPLGRCESGTRMGLCRRMDRFFCDFPISEYTGD